MHILGSSNSEDEFVDWRGQDKSERRKLLKGYIDWAMGLRPKPPEESA